MARNQHRDPADGYQYFYTLSLAYQSFEEERFEGSKIKNDLRPAETETSLLSFLFLAEKNRRKY